MKISNFLKLLLSFFFLYSCNNDDVDINTPTEDILLGENVSVYNEQAFFSGYTLISPVLSNNSYLINMEGFPVKKWTSNNLPLATYLNEDGTLIRTYKITSNYFLAGGKTGGIEMFDFEGNIIWDWQYNTENYTLHHDISMLPNGNILASVWDKKNATEAIDSGRNPDLFITNEVWAERIIEIKPVGINNAEIVWEWTNWNHLIQDFDNEKSNFGSVSEHPELINLNYSNGDANLNHINSLFYIEDFDQIVFSSRNFNEFMIIDHSTTISEAATNQGGNYNKGGNLLYRWGNPSAYNSGTIDDKKLFGQHDVSFINNNLLSNGGNFLTFNNKRFSNTSTIDEILIPQQSDGSYLLEPNQNNAPLDYAWSYINSEVYAPRVSGASRLPNGNTLITVGTEGYILEIDSNKNIVWAYNIPLETNDVFKSFRYSLNYPAFNNQALNVLDIVIE